MRARTLLAALALWVGCAAPDGGGLARIEIQTAVVDGVEGDAPRVTPADALASIARRGPGRYVAEVRGARSAILVSARGACPVELDGGALDPQAAPGARFVRLEPLVDVEGERAQVGFGQRFELRATPRCEQASGARIEWSVVGEPIPELELSADGRTARGRTPTLEAAGVAWSDAGIVPISPRTAGTRALQLTVTTLDGERWERTIEVHAAARATGVPSIAIHARTLLTGRELTMLHHPPGSEPSIERLGDDLHAFTPAARGRYVFSTAGGGGFSIAAGTHEQTDLDCGRSTCHVEATSNAARSPMTTVFARLLESPEYSPACAIACHAVGEPGTDDGGFVAVLRGMGVALPGHGASGTYDALPRELRRLSGVGCTACHGPGAIPEPGARARVVSTDVCAVCHDAPPRYGHVAAFGSTRMARAPAASIADPAVLGRAPCARCHSTEGFLSNGEQPARAELACAACHAVHAPDSGPRLMRRVPLPILPTPGATWPAPFDGGPSRVCVSCHTPDPSLDLPAASAVALVIGAFALGSDGASLQAPAPHAKLERGCLACHGTGGLSPETRGGSHRFEVAEDICRRCHENDVSAPPELARRLAAFATRFAGSGLGRAAARPRGAPRTNAERARWNAALLASDRAAWAHGATGVVAVADAIDALLVR